MKYTTFILTVATSLSLAQMTFAEDTPLAKQMDATNDLFKLIRRETDSVKGAGMAREAIDSSLKGIVELPEMVKAMPESTDKAKAAALYRKMMASMIVSFAEMEMAFLENDLEKVKVIVETIREQKSEGHDKFMEDE